MPSQHDYLVDEEMREELRRREPSAECKLAQRFNRGRRPESRLGVPPPGSDYGRYDSRLLALLWAVAENAAALRVLAQQYGWTGADPPGYADMADELLAFLWTWGRDALALKTLWTRRGRLPLERIDAETPDAVLGFLWWRERRPETRDELFRRYHLGGASDAAQDRALTLLLVVDRWDYERYPALDHLMNVSTAHRRIDAGRHRAHSPRTDQREAENAAIFRARPETAVEERDYLETNVPLELRCLHKVRENSEEQPLDLTAEELDYLARKNLHYAGGEEAGGPPLARERLRIVEWMAQHPEPDEMQIRACLPWFRQSGLSRKTRLWRLHWRADENNRLLTPLVASSEETIAPLACLIQANMDELVHRIETAGRETEDDPRGPVLVFAELVEAVQRLRSALEARRLGNGQLTRIGAWQTNVQAFVDAFPIPSKLAACRRLVYWLLHAGFPPHEAPVLHRLSDWLDGGQWLATFGRDDRAQSDLFCRRLTTLAGSFQEDLRAALDLLVLWLESTREPGEPQRRLLDADRAWWLSRDPAPDWPDGLARLANVLASAATQGDWLLAAASAGVMFRRLSDGPHTTGWPHRELQDCLLRLCKAR
ncbi:MAG TPA: hypothetical protein VMG10_29235 [Gemmataceae bacterium]|nr:hypothetical protein [Gemmataceae bacterium]